MTVSGRANPPCLFTSRLFTACSQDQVITLLVCGISNTG